MFLFDKDKAAAAICGGPEQEEKEEIEPDLDQALDQVGGELMNAMKVGDNKAFIRSLSSFVRLLRTEE